MKLRRQQRGTTTVEFAIVGAWFFLVLFAAIEFGRLIYTFNMLQEGARRAARVAAVCRVHDATVTTKALFGPMPGAGSGNVTVEYLDENGGDADSDYGAISYVRVTISGYQVPLAIPFFNPTIDAPDFVSTLPRESLGIPKSGEPPVCD